jgi:sugar phosphate isomerase/epimerase
MNPMHYRRFVLKSTIAFSLALSFTTPHSVQAESPIPKSKIADSIRINGVAVSVQAWSFNKFTAFEAIEKTSKSGAKAIELFPGQKLSPSSDEKIGPGLSDAGMQALQAHLKANGVSAVAFGVAGIPNNEAEARKLFQFLKTLGIQCINTESTDAIDIAEKMAKEFDIRVGYHNHPRRDNDPNYKVWDPNYILQLVKDRDPRVGACADSGHWVRTGLDPVECLKILRGRIVSAHFKDLHEKGSGGHDVPWGTGISNASAQLNQLKTTGFDGSLSVEYEYKWDDNLAEVTQCVEFVKSAK